MINIVFIINILCFSSSSYFTLFCFVLFFVGITNLLNQPGMQNMMNSVMNNPQMMNMASSIASSLLNGQQGSNAGAAPECNQQ